MCTYRRLKLSMIIAQITRKSLLFQWAVINVQRRLFSTCSATPTFEHAHHLVPRRRKAYVHCGTRRFSNTYIAMQEAGAVAFVCVRVGQQPKPIFTRLWLHIAEQDVMHKPTPKTPTWSDRLMTSAKSYRPHSTLVSVFTAQRTGLNLTENLGALFRASRSLFPSYFLPFAGKFYAVLHRMHGFTSEITVFWWSARAMRTLYCSLAISGELFLFPNIPYTVFPSHSRQFFLRPKCHK